MLHYDYVFGRSLLEKGVCGPISVLIQATQSGTSLHQAETAPKCRN